MQSLSQSEAREEPIEAVVMAASLGGLRAYARILSELPVGFPAPVLLVQHRNQPPSYVPEHLSRFTRLPVAHAREGDELRPGRVYAAPPGRHLLVRPDRTLALTDEEPVCFVRPAADRLFESAASVFGSRVAAVVLTGRGYDGSCGARAVRKAGGMVIAQSARTCEAPDMPVHAVETGCVDMVLPLDKIGLMLQVLAPSAPSRRSASPPPRPGEPAGSGPAAAGRWRRP